MAAIIHPTALRPAPHPLHVPPAPLRLVPLAGPSRPSPEVFRRRRLVVGAVVAVLASVLLVVVGWVALQLWSPTPPPVPTPAVTPAAGQVIPGG